MLRTLKATKSTGTKIKITKTAEVIHQHDRITEKNSYAIQQKSAKKPVLSRCRHAEAPPVDPICTTQISPPVDPICTT